MSDALLVVLGAGALVGAIALHAVAVRMADERLLLLVSHALQDVPHPVTARRIARDVDASLREVTRALHMLEAMGWAAGWWMRSLSEPGGSDYVWVAVTRMEAP